MHNSGKVHIHTLHGNDMSKQALENIKKSLVGKSELLMKQKIIQLGKNYWVMDSDENTLCNVRLDWGSNMAGNMVSGVAGRWAGRMMHYTYVVSDANNDPALEIRKGSGSFKTYFDVVEPETGERLGGIGLSRSLVGGMKTAWQDPQSSEIVLTTKGNVLRRQYSMVDGNSNEVASVRHKIVAIRDVWQLRISGMEHQLQAIVFSVVLDFEKEM